MKSDCENVQCKQVHELLDSFMARFGRMGSPHQVSASKAAIVCHEIRKLEDETATLRTQLESKDKLIKDFCHTENEVEKSALKVLTDLQVHGDSFGVPGTNQIVDTLVSEVQSLRTRLAEVEAQLQEAVRLLVRHLPPTRKEKSCE